MPYAQVHYPFENKKEFEASFPADFIAEGLDQTRGWYANKNIYIFAFYTAICVVCFPVGRCLLITLLFVKVLHPAGNFNWTVQ